MKNKLPNRNIPYVLIINDLDLFSGIFRQQIGKKLLFGDRF